MSTNQTSNLDNQHTISMIIENLQLVTLQLSLQMEAFSYQLFSSELGTLDYFIFIIHNAP